MGCARDKKGGIIADPVTEESSIPGVYVAGDASRDVLLVAVAIAEGAKAGVAINRALLQEDVHSLGNVCLWHLADIDADDEHVCFWG